MEVSVKEGGGGSTKRCVNFSKQKLQNFKAHVGPLK